MITYAPINDPNAVSYVLAVFLDRKLIGGIYQHEVGYQYRTIQGPRGEIFDSIAEVKTSLEGE